MCVKREKKQHMKRYVKECNNNLNIYQKRVQGLLSQCKMMYLKRKDTKSPHYIPKKKKKKKALPLTKMSYVNSPPKNMTTLIIPKLLPLFVMNDKG